MNSKTNDQDKSTQLENSLTGFSITKHYPIWFAISGVLIVTSVIFLSVWGLHLGIDFRGGTLRDIEFQKTTDTNEVRQGLTEGGFTALVQPVNDRRLIVKTEPQSADEQVKLNTLLESHFGKFQELAFESIGPAIGRELVNRAYWQVILVTLGVVIYISYSFRKIGVNARHFKLSSWKLGLATIIALGHDLIIPLGVFAWLGHYRGVEIDSLFVTALLTILGFSVHDTIVVFDRIRETSQKFAGKPLSVIIDYSIWSTLGRSINTSSTFIFVLLATLLFGGTTVFYFVFALLVGVAAGTYSSIFIASPILYLWQKK